MTVPWWAWAAFAAFVTAALLFDLVKHRDAHVIGFGEAAAVVRVLAGARPRVRRA